MMPIPVSELATDDGSINQNATVSRKLSAVCLLAHVQPLDRARRGVVVGRFVRRRSLYASEQTWRES